MLITKRNVLPCSQTMEHHRQHCLSYVKNKLLDNDDLLKIAFFVFTTFSFIQELSIHVWLPLFTTVLACFVHRVIRVSIKQYNFRIVFNHSLVVLLSNLCIYYWGFVWLQNLRTNIPTRQKQKEETLVLIYFVIWYFVGTCLEFFGHIFCVAIIQILLWISTKIGVVLTILSFEEILDESASFYEQLYTACIIVKNAAFPIILLICTGLV